mgnify:CR=1 FL=1
MDDVGKWGIALGALALSSEAASQPVSLVAAAEMQMNHQSVHSSRGDCSRQKTGEADKERF